MKRPYNTTLNAFTLLELLIASLLTAAIGLLIIYFINQFSSILKAKTQIQNHEEHTLVFDDLLLNDLFLSDTFYLQRQDLYIQKEDTMIHYAFNLEQGLCLRMASDSNQFNLPLRSIEYLKNRLLIAYTLGGSAIEVLYIDESDFLN